MSKILLKNDAHIFQMLGTFNKSHGYALPKDIAEVLLKMPKKPIISKDEIDVGTNVAFLESTFTIEGSPIQFCLEGGTLYLLERASEMGGLIAFTYLTPLGELTLDYFKELDINVDLNPLKERKRQRRAQYTMMQTEHERLAGRAMRRAYKVLSAQPLPEFSKLMTDGKRFIRPGKSDYNTSQLQVLEYVIGKTNTAHPVLEIINRFKTMCNNKTSAVLISDTVSELHDFKITDTKKASSAKGKKLDFNFLLAAMMKQDKPKIAKSRIMPSEKGAELLNAECEIEEDFEPEVVTRTEESSELNIELTSEEIKLQQLVSELLKKQEPQSLTQAPKVSLKGRREASQSQHVPASLNPDLER